MLRSHAAGSLRSTEVDQTVTLAGWALLRRILIRAVQRMEATPLRPLLVAAPGASGS